MTRLAGLSFPTMDGSISLRTTDTCMRVTCGLTSALIAPRHTTSGGRNTQTNDDTVAQQNHWSERGRAASVANADALGRPRRSVLSFGKSRAMTQHIHVSFALALLLALGWT